MNVHRPRAGTPRVGRVTAGVAAAAVIVVMGVGAGVSEAGTTAQCAGLKATIVGTNGPDVLRGTPGRDVIVGLGGDDTIFGGDGRDTICGGGGSDIIDAGEGNDTVFGHTAFQDGPGADTLLGGGGNDFLSGSGGGDRILGGPGDDELHGYSDPGKFDPDQRSSDLLRGGPGDDTLILASGPRALLLGEDGNDVIIQLGHPGQCGGGNGIDRIEGCPLTYGGDGPDLLFTPTNVDSRIVGSNGDDVIVVRSDRGRRLHHLIAAGDGDDEVLVYSAGDTIAYGGDGDDVFRVVKGLRPRLVGGAGHNQTRTLPAR